VENSPLALIEWDPDYRIVRWTDEAAELFGWRSDETLGRRIDELRMVYEEDWPVVRQIMADMFEGKRVRNVNPNRDYRKDGTIIYCEWYNSVLRDESGRMTSILSLVLNVTERMQAQEALQRQVHLLQRALVPAQPPCVSGYSFASTYSPAFLSPEIGGDFYDVLKTETGMVAIMIGDVSGKGTESAALAAVARSIVGAFAYDLSDPGDTLTHANSMLVSKQPDYYQFVTAFLVILNPDTGDLSYSGAGHPPAMIRRADGHIDTLISHNTPLGIDRVDMFGHAETALGPGDKLVLYTDGITEARSESGFLGMEGLEVTLAENGGGSTEELMAGIMDTARRWSHGQLRDDIALLIIGRNEQNDSMLQSGAVLSGQT
jgi:PAS domain S-box-containing protein